MVKLVPKAFQEFKYLMLKIYISIYTHIYICFTSNKVNI